MTPTVKFSGLDRLPQFPAVATKLLRALSREQANSNEIAELIRTDSSLASEVLRVVNSPLYATAARISSIQQAMLFLGFDELRRFVLTVSMKAVFQMPARLDVLRGMWRHSLACALLCEEISAACSPHQTKDDRAYTAGLLHDIGRLGLFVLHGQQYVEVLMASGRERCLLECERGAFGMDHCEAGAWLAYEWGLPEEVQRSTASHHNRPDPASSDLQNLVRIGVLATDYLGFDLIPPSDAATLNGIRAYLPRTAQFRFDPEPAPWKARITQKLDSFD